MYFLIRLRFFFILHPVSTARKTKSALKDRRVVRSLMLALAGTLGVGNVFGVALGIIVGGAGSLFWLFLSIVFSAVLKYCEVVISSDNLYHDRDAHGGMYYVIRNTEGKHSLGLSRAYAFCVLLLSFLLGASLQSGAVYETVDALLDGRVGIETEIFAGVFALLMLFMVIGGAAKIEKITEIIIPLTTIIYIIMTLTMIISHIDRLPNVLKEIFKSAYQIDSAIGGVVGFLLSKPLHEGFARGILSNEAGAGTSSIAHSRGGLLNPAQAGLLGILEVWFDTGLICMLTGLSVLAAVPDISSFTGGMELVMYAIGNGYGSVGKYIMLFCVLSFAAATVICWYYYGLESFSAIFGTRRRSLFLVFFILFVYLGAYIDSSSLVFAVDLLMLFATVLTLTALIKNSDRIVTLSERGGIISRNIKSFKKIRGSVSERGRLRRDG